MAGMGGNDFFGWKLLKIAGMAGKGWKWLKRVGIAGNGWIGCK